LLKRNVLRIYGQKINGVTGVKHKRQKKNIFGGMMLHELFLLTTGLFGCEWK